MAVTLDTTLGRETAWQGLRRAALWLLFAGVLLIPRFLSLRRRRHTWNVLRLLAAALGSVLLAARWDGQLHGLSPIILGTLLLLAALALLPESDRLAPAVATDAMARKLGASIAVRGGSYHAPGGDAIETNLFVGPENLWVVGPASDPVLVVPVRKLTLRVQQAGAGWKLALAWEGGEAEFLFSGPFAEHFARVAESTLRAQIPDALPILR